MTNGEIETESVIRSPWCLIVATRGRTREVEELLTSLAALRGAPPRILLIDQNEDGRLHRIVEAKKNQMRLEHVVIPPRGLSQARNVGITLLRDETLVAFPDDDCRYEATTLQDAEEAFAADERIEVLIGDWYGTDQNPPLNQLPNRPRPVGRIRALRRSPSYVLFFRRSAIDRAGSFDETLGLGTSTPWQCGEETDYLLRADVQEGTIACTPGVRVSHPMVDIMSGVEKAYGYGRGRMRVLAKHGYPLWFQLASIVHPLTRLFSFSRTRRHFGWRLFCGRLREWLQPHRLEDT